MENFTDAQLDAQLGTVSRQFSKFRVITIDNGSDLVGTGATGEFVEKQYDADTQTTKRIPFLDRFHGVILASKAQVVDKAKYPTWRSSEFDAQNVDALIDIFPLMSGKVIKDADGNVTMSQMTYRDLKKAKSTPQPDGSSQNTFNYFIILYVSVMGEIIKLKFAGSTRANWFDYSKLLSNQNLRMCSIVTDFTTYKDKTTGKFAANFAVVRDEKGNPINVDIDEIREQRITVAKSLTQFIHKSLPTGNQSKVEVVDDEPRYELT